MSDVAFGSGYFSNPKSKIRNPKLNMSDLETWLNLTVEDPIDPDLPICDPHHHLWDRPNNRYLLDDVLQDTGSGHNIVKTVFVECKAEYRNDGSEAFKPVGETEFVQSLADQCASGHQGSSSIAAGIVSHADLTLGDTVASGARGPFGSEWQPLSWDQAHCWLGMRVIVYKTFLNLRKKRSRKRVAFPFINRHRVCSWSPKFREGFTCLQHHGLSFDSWLFYHQLGELTDLARAFPETSIILDHIGGPLGIGPYTGKRDEVIKAWQNSIQELATCPNVTVKLGGMGMPIFGFGWHKLDIPPSSTELAVGMAPYFNFCIDKFGVDRCMFESNFPVDKVSFSYSVHVERVQAHHERFHPGRTRGPLLQYRRKCLPP